MEEDIRGYPIESCSGPGISSNRAVKCDNLRPELENENPPGYRVMMELEESR